MALTATLYRIEDDPQTLIKLLDNPEATVQPITLDNNIKPTGTVDVISPSFILNYNANYLNYNYIHVGPPFNRYYFINDFQIDIGTKITISCSIDVLQTYFNAIMGCPAQIIRTGRWADNSRYLADNIIPVSSWTQVQNYEFDKNPFDPIDSASGRYVLTVIGGAVSQAPQEGGGE